MDMQRNCELEIKSALIQHPEHYEGDKTLPNMPSSLFCFGLLLLGMCLLLTVVCFPSKTPLGKINISFLNGNQLEIDIRLGMGFMCLFLLKTLTVYLV